VYYEINHQQNKQKKLAKHKIYRKLNAFSYQTQLKSKRLTLAAAFSASTFSRQS
jgi:hypothetical protein